MMKMKGVENKAGAMADQYRRVAGRNGATGDDARAAQYSRRAEVLDKIAKGAAEKPTAKPKSGKARAPTPAMHAKSEARKEYKSLFGKEAPKSLTTSQMQLRMDVHRHRNAEIARASKTISDVSNKASASRTLDIGARVREGVAAKLDPAKIIDARNATARSLAEQAKFTGVDAGRGAAARDLVGRNTADLARLGNDAHMGTTSHAPAANDVRGGLTPNFHTEKFTRQLAKEVFAPPPASPPSTPKQPMLSRLGNAYGKAQTGLTLVAAGAQGAHAFSEDRAAGGSVSHAAFEGMKAAAPGTAMAAAPTAAAALSKVSSAGAVGASARVGGALLQTAGKFALPAAVGIGAVQGAREDSNTLRGAGRGVVRSLDPTGIVTGLTGHGAGLGERIYDAAFGKAQARFQAASSAAKESQVAADKKGWANPKVQAAAQKAKGNTYNGPME